MADKVGYRSPPKRTRFKKGQSGNPNGRPKKSKNFMTLLANELDEQVTINEDGRKRKISKMEAMVKRIVAGALMGDRKAINTLVDILRRTDQMGEQEIEDILPSNAQDILAHYVQSHASKPKKGKNNV